MRHSVRNILFHELIGLDVEVVKHSSRSLEGLKGRVVDETRNTLLVETQSGERKRVPKLYGLFKFRLPSGRSVVVDGTQILGRPEDRLKRVKQF